MVFQMWQWNDSVVLIEAPQVELIAELEEVGFQKIHEIEAPTVELAQEEFVRWAQDRQPDAEVVETDLSGLFA